jgi:hypothetical protein
MRSFLDMMWSMPARAQRQQRHEFAGLDLGDRGEIAAGFGDASHALKLQLNILDLILERDQWRIGSGHRSALQVRRTIPPTLGISPKLDARRRDEHHGGTGPLAHAAEHVDLVRCARARSWP